MQKNNKKILFTGGGTAGHVVPNLVLMRHLKAEGYDVFYIGSKNSIEQKLVAKNGVPFFTVTVGKLRRYFSFKNFIDPFKIIYGAVEAFFLLGKIEPQLVFSKGGFVTFPVVVAAWLRRIPIIIHESDLTIGLANKLCFPFANKICVAFADTAKAIKNKNKIVITGIPVRAQFFDGNIARGLELCGFSAEKKVLLFFGGSLGAVAINNVVYELLPELLEKWQVVHVCGEGKLNHDFDELKGYKQFEYLYEDFPHIIAAANLVISRAGANTIYELITLKKPSILIPLGTEFSRGDQVLNAQYCKKNNFSLIINSHELTKEVLLNKIIEAGNSAEKISAALQKVSAPDSVTLICSLIKQVLV